MQRRDFFNRFLAGAASITSIFGWRLYGERNKQPRDWATPVAFFRGGEIDCRADETVTKDRLVCSAGNGLVRRAEKKDLAIGKALSVHEVDGELWARVEMR